MNNDPRMTNAGWKTVALGNVATIERSAIQPEDIEQGTEYLGLEHVESGGRILGAKPVDEGELASSKFKFTEQHVLYGKLRPYLAKIALPDFTGICSTDILPILPGPDLERRFLCYFLRQPAMVDFANSRASGANLPRLSPSVLAKLEIPLPPLGEQRRIAEVLDRAEALRAKRRAALAQLDTSPNPSSSTSSATPPPTRKAGLAFRSMSCSRTSTAVGVRSVSIVLWMATNGAFSSSVAVTWCEYNPAENKALPPNVEPDTSIEVKAGDLLFAQKNTYELVAACALVRETSPRLLMSDLIFRLRLRPEAKVDSCFLHQLLIYPTKRRDIQKLAGGSAGSMPNISKARLETTPIELPPIPLQHDFARRVTAVEKLKTAQRASLAELEPSSPPSNTAPSGGSCENVARASRPQFSKLRARCPSHFASTALSAERCDV